MSLTRDKNPSPAKHVLPFLQQLAAIPKPERAYLESRLSFCRLARGECLTRAGDVADRVGFVVSGLPAFKRLDGAWPSSRCSSAKLALTSC